MKISTRILISLILSLTVLGVFLIGLSYNNTKEPLADSRKQPII